MGWRWPRYRVRVSWFNGICEGSVEALTYRDQSVRLVRVYGFPPTVAKRVIGVMSFIGIPPFEQGYEVQLPLLLPESGDPIPVLEWRPGPE